MPVNQDRLSSRIERLSAFGRTASGGLTRLSWSEPFGQAVGQTRQWMEEASLTTRTDSVGNLISRREGRQAELPAIMLGSHLDSVVEGGHFDGPAGVLAGLEVAQALAEDGVSLEHPLEVVAFVEEEGARFSSGFIGGRGMLGQLGTEVQGLRDHAGVPFQEVLRAYGLDPDRLGEAARSPDEMGAYLELHIEQGPVLEAAGQAVGIVSGIVGLIILSLTLRGQANHAGGTPMDMRHDALAGAAEVALAVERAALGRPPTARGTVGKLEVSPGQHNVIPGQVRLSLDLRDREPGRLSALESEIRGEVENICGRRGLTAEWRDLMRAGPVDMHPLTVAALRAACFSEGLPAPELPSGAGHDAQVMASAAPAGMLFVRCRQGISHSPQEQATPEDLATGARVLYQAVQELDRGLSC